MVTHQIQCSMELARAIIRFSKTESKDGHDLYRLFRAYALFRRSKSIRQRKNTDYNVIKHIQKAFYSTFFSLNFALCLHLFISSLRLLSESAPLFFRITHFSDKQTSHAREPHS